MANPLLAMLKKGIDDVQRVAFGLWPRWNGWGWGRVRMLLPSARFDWEQEAGDPWRNSTVALGLAWLGDRFPRPRVSLSKVSRGGDHVPIGRHPVLDLWARPNPYYTRRTMEKAIGLSLKCDGNAYIQKVRDRVGRVVQLWWIPHFRCAPTWPSDGSEYVNGYRIGVDGRNFYHIPAEDVIHIRDGIDPWNERIGLSALRAALREVVTLNLANGYAAALLKNSGVPSVAFVPTGPNPPRPDKDAADRIKERFGEEFGGDLIGSPLVAAGQYEIVKLGFSPEELALDKLPRDAEARVAASIGVAAMSLGLPDPNKTYSNLGEANRSSWGTVVSIQELIAEAVQFDLLPEKVAVPSGVSNGLDPMAYAFGYDYSEIQELQESLDAVHTRTREDWKAGVIRLNEAREQLGYEPDPDGDRFFPNTGSESDAANLELQASLKQPKPGDEPAKEGQTPGDEEPTDGKAWTCCGELKLLPDYSRFPSPNEYAATEAAFEGYLADCKAHPVKGVVIDDLAEWLTKYNHCHGRDGRFCGGSSRGAGGSFSRIGGNGKPAGGGDEGGKPVDLARAPEAEIGKVHGSMSGGWSGSLGEGQKAAVSEYTSNKFQDVNRYLRKGSTLQMSDEEAGSVVKGVDGALAKASLKEPMTVYRGIADIKDLGLSESGLKGVTIHDKAFLSTSLSPSAAHEFVGKDGAVLKITAPKGAKGASMSGLSKYPGEHEVLFARGSALKVTGHFRDKEGRLVIEATLHHGGGKSLVLAPMAAKAEGKGRAAAKFGWRPGDVEIDGGKSLALANVHVKRWGY